MVTGVSQGAKWFLDTSYALALASRSGAGHEKARALASDIVRNRVARVTSQAVLLEIGNATAKSPLRMFGVRLLEQIHRDPADRGRVARRSRSMRERARPDQRARESTLW